MPLIEGQQRLWEQQHARRGASGFEATLLRHSPNDAAILLASALCSPSNILEAGCASGRDARFWGSLGHKVDCIDFSPVALQQLTEQACEEGVAHLLRPHCHDISDGSLPPALNGTRYDAFYARSALHLGDDPLHLLAHSVTQRMNRGGYVVIEGKGPSDHKIKRSRPLGEGLVCDHDGHIRRVWTGESMEALSRENGWHIIRLDEIREEAPYGCNEMLRLIARVPIHNSQRAVIE